jgi:hypothetical protein
VPAAELPAALRTRAGAIADLAVEHRARWLGTVLPDGPCLVVAGGALLASALAADGRRPVVLVERTAARVELALRTVAPGVRIVHGALDRIDLAPATFASAVVILSPACDSVTDVQAVDDLVGRQADLAVVAAPRLAARARAALERTGRAVSSFEQLVRAASCIGVGEAPVLAGSWAATSPAAAEATVLVAGTVGVPSALLGPDTGPTTLRAIDDLVDGVTSADGRAGSAERDAARVADVRRLVLEAEQAIDMVPGLHSRLDATRADLDATRADLDATRADLDATRARLVRLDAELATAKACASALATRVDELLSSTSWNVTAPMRWLSDRIHHR